MICKERNTKMSVLSAHQEDIATQPLLITQETTAMQVTAASQTTETTQSLQTLIQTTSAPMVTTPRRDQSFVHHALQDLTELEQETPTAIATHVTQARCVQNSVWSLQTKRIAPQVITVQTPELSVKETSTAQLSSFAPRDLTVPEATPALSSVLLALTTTTKVPQHARLVQREDTALQLDTEARIMIHQSAQLVNIVLEELQIQLTVPPVLTLMKQVSTRNSNARNAPRVTIAREAAMPPLANVQPVTCVLMARAPQPHLTTHVLEVTIAHQEQWHRPNVQRVLTIQTPLQPQLVQVHSLIALPAQQGATVKEEVTTEKHLLCQLAQTDSTVLEMLTTTGQLTELLETSVLRVITVLVEL